MSIRATIVTGLATLMVSQTILAANAGAYAVNRWERTERVFPRAQTVAKRAGIDVKHDA
jgi:DUF1009 family protein